MAGSGLDLIAEGIGLLASEDVEGRWLGDDLVALHQLRDRLDAQLSRRVGVFDGRGDAHGDGHRSTAGWLVDRCRMSPGDAHREVRAARSLRRLPAVKGAWEAGATTSAHVQCLARVRHRAKADQHFDGLEATWWGLAVDQPVEVLGTALAGFMDRLDNTRPADESQAVEAIERRMLITSKCLGAGLVESRFDLDGYEQVMNAIDLECDRGHVDGDLRTIEQQRADALVEICRHYNQCTATPGVVHPPVVNIVSDARTLAQLEAGLCESDRGLAWSVETVRRLCCSAEIGRILVGEDDEILNLGRTRRLFSQAQRRALHYRDRGCCFPGCSRPVRQTEPHHITPWDDHGPTDLDNACSLCWAHHRLVHELRWTIHRHKNGSIDWYRPDRTYHATWHPPGRPPPIKA